MPYLLLTGATGLLGTFLLRDLTRAGVELAVLVRSTRRESARQRVEAIFAHWEREAGHALPRPVVFDGDLSRPGLGLSDRDRRRAAECCDTVMHNAASLTFVADARTGEPYRTNVEGTRNLLGFCREAGLRRFHHVSTAYVCGSRRGRILESELDAGQTLGNDYEVSKFESEKLVREAAFLDPPTVYRPGIILGDSKTGYTTTYHGFYVPMQLVNTTLRKVPAHLLSPEELRAAVAFAGERLRSVLRLDGAERKNFVPVDWVSAAMTEIYVRPDRHGLTYHLTPRERARIAIVQECMEEEFLDEIRRNPAPPSQTSWRDGQWEQFEEQFVKGMEVYRSYWTDDPEFDATNTAAAAPNLPCPPVDAAMMRTMCRFALEANFGWRRAAPPRPEFDVQTCLKAFPRAGAGPEPAEHVGLRVTGPGGGQWELAASGGRIVGVEAGIGPGCAPTLHLNSATFRRLAEGGLSPEEAVATGRVLVEGDAADTSDPSPLLRQLVAPPATPDAAVRRADGRLSEVSP